MNANATPTDAQLLAAIDLGIANGSIIEVTDELLAKWAAEADEDEAPMPCGHTCGDCYC